MAALLLAAGRARLLWCPRNRLPFQFLFERKGDSQSPGNQQEAQGTGRWPLWDFLGIRFTVLNFQQLEQLEHVVSSSSTVSLKTQNLRVALVGKGIQAWEAADGVTPSVHALNSCTRPQGAWMRGGMGLLESRTLPSAR